MGTLKFDRHGVLNLEVGGNHSFIVRLRQFSDPAKTIAEPFIDTHKMVISEDEDGNVIKYTVSTENIMTIVGNVMTIDFTTTINTFKARRYFLDWRSDDGTGHSVPIGRGFITINHTQAKP